MKLMQTLAAIALFAAAAGAHATAPTASVGEQGSKGVVECPYMQNSDWTKSAKDSLRRTASSESSKQPGSNSGAGAQSERSGNG